MVNPIGAQLGDLINSGLIWHIAVVVKIVAESKKEEWSPMSRHQNRPGICRMSGLMQDETVASNSRDNFLVR